MKTTKKLACIFAAFAMVMITYSPVRADYSTTKLTSSSTFSLNCTLNGGASVAVTIYWLKDGSVVDVELLTDPADNIKSIPRRATRAVFEVDAPRGTTGLFRISQNGQSLAEDAIGGTAPHDLRWVADIQ